MPRVNDKDSKTSYYLCSKLMINSQETSRHYLFKRQSHKKVIHTQTIRLNCFSMFDQFVGLALKGLTSF